MCHAESAAQVPGARLVVVNATGTLALVDQMTARRPPVDNREATSIERFRTDLARLSDPCSEAANPTHVTASAIVVGPRGVLLHRHKRLGIWLQPGGHIDPGEDPADAAMREVLEETGIATEHFAGAPKLVHVDAHDGPRGHFHLDLRFLLTAGNIDPNPPESESQEVRWWSWFEARAISEPGLAGILRALTVSSLRNATADDGPDVGEIYLRSFQWTYEATPVRLAHPPSDVRRWAREILLTEHAVTVAVCAGIVVGFSAEKPGWLDQLYVDPAWAGRGVGDQLLRNVKNRQAQGFDLWTFEANRRACAFYERHHLVGIEHGDGSGNEEGQPDIRYRWSGEGS